jgi:hypothetical protein
MLTEWLECVHARHFYPTAHEITSQARCQALLDRHPGGDGHAIITAILDGVAAGKPLAVGSGLGYNPGERDLRPLAARLLKCHRPRSQPKGSAPGDQT